MSLMDYNMDAELALVQPPLLSPVSVAVAA